MIDESTDLGALVSRHLRDDRIVWLTTVTPGGSPVPSPIAAHWTGRSRSCRTRTPIITVTTGLMK